MRKLTKFIPDKTRSGAPKSKPVSVRLDPLYIKALDKISAEYGTSRRGVVQAMIEREAIAMKIMAEA